MRQTSPEVLAQIYGEQMDEPIFALLEIKDADSGESAYLANNTKTVTHQGQAFAPTRFTLALPDEEDGTLAEVRLVIDNVNQGIGRLIEKTQGRPTATLIFVREQDPDSIEWGPFKFTLEQGQYDVQRASAKLAYQDVTTRRYPKHGYTPGWTPELY